MINLNENIKGYDVIAILKDIKNGTGNYTKKLIFLDYKSPAMKQMDCFDIITKSLVDYDIVLIVVYYKKTKLVKLTLNKESYDKYGRYGKNRTERIRDSLSIQKLDNRKIRVPAIYPFDFPKGSLIKTELNKVF